MLLRPARRDLRGRSVATRALVVAAALWLASGAASTSWAQGAPVTFSVIGDIPYSDALADRFRGFVADHNAFSPAEFFVHVGDIQTQSDLCPESGYLRAADIMRELAVPAFVLPGDNEWNDCGDPDAAWILWEAHFLGFEQDFCGTPDVEAQAARPENFAFVRERVLFLGLNLVGGTVHDPAEWSLRMQQDADWVEQQLAQASGQVRAAVVLGQAARGGGRDPFFDRFDLAALGFARPILYIHGDGHTWLHDAAWGVPNLSRIQIEQGDPPLQVTVTLDPENPFVFTRDPWPAGAPILNQPPCVDAGPDRVVASGQGAELSGLASDDGDPTASVAVEWSQVSGPDGAQAVFSDPASVATAADFPEAGTYVLRLTADDGGLTASDDVAVFVDAGQPYLKVADASVVEGDTGTTTASFRVDLVSASGAPVSVGYATLDAEATGGSDYQASSGTLDFSGTTASRTIDVPVIGDEDLEEFEDFVVILVDPSGAVIADGAATGLIRDDDIPRTPVVTSFLPARGPPGTVVWLTGDFHGVLAVSVGGAPAPFTLRSEGELELVVPPEARSGPISVANVAGTGLSPTAFGVEFPLSVAVTGAGSVSVDPPGGMQLDGATVRLTPLPAPGWEFLMWGGAAEGSAVPAVIGIAGETHVSALFVEQGSVIRVPVSAPVPSGNDDAEEDVASGTVDLASGDLELAVDTGSAQAVGLRFPGVGIPQGTPIVSARVQFTVDEASGGPVALTVQGEAADDAAPFSATRYDVTRRQATSASVGWTPPAWSSTRAAGAEQRTPDLAALIQEIVDRPGWAPGHALVLTLTGTGTRIAESRDGNAAAAARLEILGVIDVAPPETPANLRSPSRTETSIDLAWDASTDNLGVTGYRLYAASGPIDLVGTATTATGLEPDTAYTFQVSALDAAGNESPPSPPLVVRTVAPDTEPPSTPQNLRSPAQTGTSLDLAWDAATDDRGVVAYRIYRPSGPVEVAGTTWTATGLAPGAAYAFQVTALDAAGNESPPSALLVVRTLAPDTAPPSTPANLRSPAQTTTRIDLAWDAASDGVAVIGYRLYRAGGAVDVAGTSWSETGLQPGREYGFQIAALDAAGNESPPSPVLRVRTDRPPTTPANLRSPARTETTLDLAWDAATDDRGAVSYRLYGPGGSVDLAGTSWTATGLAPDTQYAFQVSALDTAGNESPRSPPLVVRTLALDIEPPTTPANLRSPAQTTTRIDLAWDAATDARSAVIYRLYRLGGSVDLAATSWTETGLLPGREYPFRVSALDAAGNESASSPILRVRTDEPPTTPANLRSPARTETSLDLAWDVATDDRGVVGYRLYGPGSTAHLVGTTWTATGLAPDTQYAFHVSALDTGGNESLPSLPLVVRTLAPDTAPPSTPANLHSPAQTTTRIDLAWDAASDGVAVIGYRLYRAGGAVDVAGTSWSETGLQPGREYGFQIAALDAAGNESPPSPVLRVRTDRPPTTPANLRSPARTETTLDLAWDAATDDRGAVSYRLYGPGGSVDLAGTSWTATGLAPDTEYAFQVSALDTAGNESPRSPPLVVRTLALDIEPPTTPANLRSPAQTETSIDLAWDAATDDRGVVGYRLYGPSGSVDLAATSWTATGLAPDTEYAFQVSALDAAGNESPPGPVLSVRTVTPDQPPTTPANLHSPAQTETSIDLAWDAATDDRGVVGYRLYGPGGSVDLAGTSWTATGLAPDTEYAFRVSAFDAAGNESPPGPVLSVRTVTPDQPPTTPANLRSPARTETSLDLAWDASADDIGVVGYRVYGPSGSVDLAGTSWTATGLAPDTEYAFQVSALDSAGNESPRSPPLVVRTLALDTEPPSTPANLHSPAQTEASIDLAWDAATDDRGVVAYRVYAPSGAVAVAGTSYTETGLAPLTGYEFQVSALDAAGNESARSPVLGVSTLGQVPRASSHRVAAGSDDAEENVATGAINLNSADLELTVEVTTSQLVGLRFRGVAVPQGARIASASVQFTADEVRSGPVALVLRGQAADDAAAFAGTAFNVSGRAVTSGSVAWSPPDWTAVGAAGPAQRTPDLAALVQEIVDRPGWTSGNSLVLLVGGSGTRVAESFEGAPGAAALLEIVYLGDPDTQPPITPGNLRSPAQTETSIDLAWNASADDFGVVGYRLYGPSGAVETPGTTWTASGLAPDTEYAFQVSALDEAGNESAPSPLLRVRTLAPDVEPPSTPANLRSPAQSASRIELAWDAATDNVGVTGYRVYAPSGAVDVAGTSYTATGLAPLTAYEFQVSALDAEGNESARSAVLGVSTTDTEILIVRVSVGGDDAEENAATGAVNLTNGDLELGVDATASQVVGLRFPGVAVPQGAPIVSASVQFTADEVRSGPVALTLWGEAADDAAAFAGTAFNVSGRAVTSGSVAWSPPDWTAVGAAGPAERTPDLSALVQEIVDRPGWAPGRSLVLMLSGTGTRTAESFNGLPAAAPVLRIEYRVGAPGPP